MAAPSALRACVSTTLGSTARTATTTTAHLFADRDDPSRGRCCTSAARCCQWLGCASCVRPLMSGAWRLPGRGMSRPVSTLQLGSGGRLAVKRFALALGGRAVGDGGAAHPLGGGEVEAGPRRVGDGDGDVLLQSAVKVGVV